MRALRCGRGNNAISYLLAHARVHILNDIHIPAIGSTVVIKGALLIHHHLHLELNTLDKAEDRRETHLVPSSHLDSPSGRLVDSAAGAALGI
jgi:hypothetical protein